MTPKKSQVPLRSFYKPRARRPTIIEGPSMTKTDHAKGTDVNDIIRKFNRTGVLDHVRRVQGVYADVSHFGSYQDAVHRVQEAQAHFDALPANMKAVFDNDAARFLDWANSATEEDRQLLVAESLGLSTPESPPSPAPADPEPAGE